VESLSFGQTLHNERCPRNLRRRLLRLSRQRAPQRFTFDEEIHDIASIGNQWGSPNAIFFKLGSTEDKGYLLRYDERLDQWTVESGFDGDALLARPSIQPITVEPKGIRAAESKIAGCERCRPDESEIPFDWILADIIGKRGSYEFVPAETARGPNCRAEVLEKTLIEPQGGIEVEVKHLTRSSDYCYARACRRRASILDSLGCRPR
jgi:hypothetical protein